MKKTKFMMGMTINVEIADQNATQAALDRVFDYFHSIDERFSVYKTTSEISAINKGILPPYIWSSDMKTVFDLSEKTKSQTDGYFDIRKADGSYDPSGLVKGWAIYNAAQMLLKEGFKNFYIDAGGDIQPYGANTQGQPWRIGIRNPFNPEKEIIKILRLTGYGVATSGTYLRGQHIYDPHNPKLQLTEIVSLTVIGPNVFEADRFATAAFAMGPEGINFIEKLKGFEGYQIDAHGQATMTTGFNRFTAND